MQKEDALFYYLNNIREAKPVDYPQDNTTSPNTAVAKLNGSDPDKRIGPILKVMAGDTIQAAVRAYYKQQATPQNNAGLPVGQMLAGLVQALVALHHRPWLSQRPFGAGCTGNRTGVDSRGPATIKK